MSSLAKLLTSFKIGVSKTQSKRRKMEEEGMLYKADGKPNILLLMEKTGLTRQRARFLAKKGFKNVPHGNIGKEREA